MTKRPAQTGVGTEGEDALFKREGAITTGLMGWFRANKRPLPWRRAYNPYHVWVSEVMGQQTQMERVVAYFERWIARFPTVESVASAPIDEILKLWEGLGYYSRAKNLQRAARVIVDEREGLFPQTAAELRALPGLGPYSAAAIASIAFKQDVPLIDANVERVISRLFDIRVAPKSKAGRSAILDHLERMLPKGEARDFNQALMELGALICNGTEPPCGRCPLRGFCEACALGSVALLPVKPPPKPLKRETQVALLALSRGTLAIRQRPQEGLWAGLWEYPKSRVEASTPPLTAAERLQHELGVGGLPLVSVGAVEHSYTVHRVTLHGFLVPLPDHMRPRFEGGGFKWCSHMELAKLAFAAGDRKLNDLLAGKWQDDLFGKQIVKDM